MAQNAADSALFESVSLNSVFCENNSWRNIYPTVDPVSCSLCGDSRGIPFSFPCGHLGCLDCLQKIQNHSTLQECPVCEAPSGAGQALNGPVDTSFCAVSRVGDVAVERGRKCFIYEDPLPEETGPWIPLSIPPSIAGTGQLEICGYGGEFFPDDHNNCTLVPELTAWRIFVEVVATVIGSWKSKRRLKLPNARAGDLLNFTEGWEDSFDPLAQSFTDQMEDHVKSMTAVLASEPPQWLPDSSAFTCMQCSARFHPITCSRHHCRFCGGIFCSACTSGRCLLPVKFREKSPQRVCDCCGERLGPVQGILLEQVSSAAQVATHDVTDLSCLRSWVNSPIGLTLEHEIYKATNTVRTFSEARRLKPERSIPEAVLKGVRGLAILTVMKVGMVVSYKLGSGLVIVKRGDGSWSAPSAIVSCGVGWGAQFGGELTDFIFVLRNEAAVKAFAGRVHLSMGAGLSVTAGPVGRTAEADIRAGDGGAAGCYTYSLSKGAFIGCSLEGDVVCTRAQTNLQFYGDPFVNAYDILLGSVKQPRAAAPLYDALSSLFSKVSGGIC